MKKDIDVVGAIIVERGKVLCAKRGPSRVLAHKWEFPGGKIEEGETPEAALQREVEEELCCQIEIVEQVDHTVHEYDFAMVHLTTFLCKLVSGTPKLTEHDEIKWLVPHDLKTLDWAPADVPSIDKLVHIISSNNSYSH